VSRLQRAFGSSRQPPARVIEVARFQRRSAPRRLRNAGLLPRWAVLGSNQRPPACRVTAADSVWRFFAVSSGVPGLGIGPKWSPLVGGFRPQINAVLPTSMLSAEATPRAFQSRDEVLGGHSHGSK
jgi:hypothetical protein